MCSPDYKFEKEGPQNASHFTQIVWQETEVLGIGKAAGTVNGVPCTIIVARYEPAGNLIGSFQKNVKQGKFTKESCSKIDEAVEVLKSENLVKEGSGKDEDSEKPSEESNKESGQKNEAKESQSAGTSQSSEGSKDPGKEDKSEKNQSDEFDDIETGKSKPSNIPNKNKGINPTATQKHPSKSLKGETKPGAKQEQPNGLLKTAKVISLGQSEELPQLKEGSQL